MLGAGGYHVDLTEADGYSSSTNGPGPMKYMALRPAVALTGPDTYNPGEIITLTASLVVPYGSVHALAWLP